MKIFEKLLEQLSTEEFRQLLRIQDELEEKLCINHEYEIKVKLPNKFIITDIDNNVITFYFIKNVEGDIIFNNDDNKFLKFIGKDEMYINEVSEYFHYLEIIHFLNKNGYDGGKHVFLENSREAEYTESQYEKLIPILVNNGWVLKSKGGFNTYDSKKYPDLYLNIQITKKPRTKGYFTIWIEGFE